MENIFFSNGGITSTSANYYANMTKELIQADMKKLENIKFYTTTMTSIIGGNEFLMSEGVKDTDWIKPVIERICNMHALCAWLREAIKAKEDMLRNIPAYHAWEVQYKEPIEEPIEPVFLNINVSEEDILKTWKREDRLEYLQLEAFASTYGKYIHPKYNISIARENAHKVATNPTEVQGSGRESIIYTKKLTTTIEEIDKTFMNLQSNYRKFEKRLNLLKAKLKEEANKEETRRNEKYQKEMREYNQNLQLYQIEINKRHSEYQDWLINQKEEISKLKIYIPKDLLSTYMEVEELSK